MVRLEKDGSSRLLRSRRISKWYKHTLVVTAYALVAFLPPQQHYKPSHHHHHRRIRWTYARNVGWSSRYETQISLQRVSGHSDINGQQTGKLTRQRRMQHAPTKASWQMLGNQQRLTRDGNGAPHPTQSPIISPRHRRDTTGRNYLQSHLHRIAVVAFLICPVCSRGEGTSEHLDVCSGLEDPLRQHWDTLEGRARLYWAARRQKARRNFYFLFISSEIELETFKFIRHCEYTPEGNISPEWFSHWGKKYL